MTYDLTYLSLGGGVQSKTLIKLSALGLFGVPKASNAIFADTGDELDDTYREIDALEKWCEPHGIKVERVAVGTSLAAAAVDGIFRLNGNRFFVSIPMFTTYDHPLTERCEFCSEDDPHPLHELLTTKMLGASVRHYGVLRRQCTNEFKLAPIRKRVRELLGLEAGARAKGKTARALIGISLDEASRMKPSRDSFITNCYPLVDARISRRDCIKWLLGNGFNVPIKSACRFCPYHDDAYWKWQKEQRPADFALSCEFDEKIRDLAKAGVKGVGYIHRSCKPLREVDFDAKVVKEQGEFEFVESAGKFGAECEGMCGV